MKTKLTLTLLALAAVSINLNAATSALPAPLPGLMTHEQLAKNTQQVAAEYAAKDAAAQEPSTQFFTGKPYVADAGGYIYKYRTYNPEMSRWTTADPSGFPDGVNNFKYAPIPASEFDPLGLSPEKAGIPDPKTGSFDTSPILKSISLSGEAGNGVQTYVDTWSATWSAEVTMTFNNPWGSSSHDSPTKTGTATYSVTVTGSLSYPFLGINTVPIPISIPTPTQLAEAGAELVAELFHQGIDSYNSTTNNVNPLSISSENISYAGNDINSNKPAVSIFANQFPEASYAKFQE